ncbi:MAG: hydrogenase iron-sulfur subunit [Actinobacteria bacterium]|nr:hydrogenase iron-sulfur subunit [Actinomycetota bacterium]
MSNFEPEIIAFCCNQCAYAAADLTGSMRMNYPPNVKIIKLPCAGKFETIYMLKAFEMGADGGIVAGCLEGCCHYRTGNLQAAKRIKRVKRILKELGLEEERVDIFYMSSAMGREFAEAATKITETVRKLGPNPIKKIKSEKVKI